MKTVIVIMILVVWTAGEGRAQDQRKIDSLKSRLTGTTDQKSYPLLWGLAYELYDVNNPEAVFYARRAHEVALQMGDSLQIVKSGRILGQLLRRVNRLEESIEHLTKVLPIAERREFRREVKIVLNALSLTYSETVYKELALEFAYRSLRIRQEDGDFKEIGEALNNIALLYDLLGLKTMALDYYLQALEIAERASYEYLITATLANIGELYVHIGDSVRAIQFLGKSIQTCAPNCPRTIQCTLEYGYGQLALNGADIPKAVTHFTKCWSLSEENRFKSLSLAGLLQAAIKTRNIFAADSLYRQLQLQLPKNFASVHTHIIKVIADYHLIKGDLHQVVASLKTLNQLREGELRDNTVMRISDLQIQFAQQENIDRIKSQQAVLNLQEEKIKLGNWLIVVTTLLMLFAFALIVLLFRNLKIKDEINKLLDLKVRERTEELENSHNQLVHSHNEQLVILKQIHTMILSALSTWKGLSHLADLDGSEMGHHYRQAVASVERVRDTVMIYLDKNR